jgi:hypothetical protein
MRAVAPIFIAFFVVGVFIGCESGVDSGPLAFGIVSGNNQTAQAGSDRLTNPVVGKLVRTPDGGITFNLVRSAYAQGTVVNGSPVPGAVVCAVSISEDGMVPWVPCTNTDSAGKATFFFTPGTRADTVRSEIRGTVEGEPAVFDTASAVVQPGPLAAWGGGRFDAAEGDTVDVKPGVLGGRDEWFNDIVPDSIRALPIRWTWVPYRTGSNITPLPETMPDDAGSGWTVVVPEGSADWKIDCPGCSEEPTALLVAWIDGVRNAFKFHISP